MTMILIVIGAMFFFAGMVSGLVSVFRGSKLHDYLYREQRNIFERLSVPGTDPAYPDDRFIHSKNLWRYIKSGEDNAVAEIFQYKKKIKRSFLLFAIFCMIGISSVFTAVIILIVS